MLDCIKNTNCYKSLRLTDNHAYLFYSLDSFLNKEIALTRAGEILCENGSFCGKCPACLQFKSLSHPDLTIIEQDSIKVEDISKIVNLISTKPVQSKTRILIIFNADVINETAQNKLLKSLEEPNDSTVFILTTNKLSKLLPTILSRLNKVFVHTLSLSDKKLISDELKKENINIEPVIEQDFNLTESINLVTNNDYSNTLNQVFNLLENLNTTADISSVVSSLEIKDKSLFFSCLMDIFLDILTPKKFDKNKILALKLKYNDKAVIKILPHIDEAYKYVNANVNFTYVLDNLLFKILQEKFLCK